MDNILRISVERDNIIDYRFHEVSNTRIIRNNNKIRRDPNHNQENVSEEERATTHSKLGGYGINTSGDTGSILIARILTESEDARTVNNNKHTNYKQYKLKML